MEFPRGAWERGDFQPGTSLVVILRPEEEAVEGHDAGVVGFAEDVLQRGEADGGKVGAAEGGAGNAHVEPGLHEPAGGEAPAVSRLPGSAELALEDRHDENSPG